jgi:hypothetical protein
VFKETTQFFIFSKFQKLYFITKTDRVFNGELFFCGAVFLIAGQKSARPLHSRNQPPRAIDSRVQRQHTKPKQRSRGAAKAGAGDGRSPGLGRGGRRAVALLEDPGGAGTRPARLHLRHRHRLRLLRALPPRSVRLPCFLLRFVDYSLPIVWRSSSVCP